jgi:TonB family protein
MRSLLVIFVLAAAVSAQRIAILQPDASGQVESFSSSVRSQLAAQFKMLDDAMADSAYRSVTVDDPFNLSTSEARRIGEVIGVNNFVILRSAIQRRASLGRPAYFEGYAIAYVVESRTGQLIAWFIESVDGSEEKDAAAELTTRADKLSKKISDALKVNRFTYIRDPKFVEVASENSPLAKGLRTPVPYRRLRPEYTELASMYGVKATVDIEVDIDADGSIARTSIERWAGFGLEDSVEKTVRAMNWRPAMREGKPLPMRVLLRYNFTKIEKDEAP